MYYFGETHNVSWCYFVKYIGFEISLLLTFTSQGSIETYVRCGGKQREDFIANFLWIE